MAKIHLEIADDRLRNDLEKTLVSAGHETGPFVLGSRPMPDVVLTDSPSLSGVIEEFKNLGMSVITICQPSSDPRELAIFDDFLIGPVKSEELLLRISVAASKKMESFKGIVIVDGLRMNTESYEVFADDELLDLTYKEFELLKYLIENPGIVLTRDKLLDKVWGYEYFGGTRTVDVHIRRLRSKLGVKYEEYIETIRNVGYRFRKMRR